MISDEQGKKWLLQKLYDDGWRYCACRYNGELYLTNGMPMVDMESGYINIYSCNKFKYADCLKSVFPKMKGNEVLNIARELGIIDWFKVSINTPILVRDLEWDAWKIAHFARCRRGHIFVWEKGKTSYTTKRTEMFRYAKLVGDTDE